MNGLRKSKYRTGVVFSRVRIVLFVAFLRVCHPSFYKFAHTRICRQSEHIVDPKGVTQIHNLRGAVVAVGPKQNPGIRPMSAD